MTPNGFNFDLSDFFMGKGSVIPRFFMGKGPVIPRFFMGKGPVIPRFFMGKGHVIPRFFMLNNLKTKFCIKNENLYERSNF